MPRISSRILPLWIVQAAVLVGALSSAFLPIAMAQAVTNETPTAETLKRDEVLVLSPFTVQGDQQQGWTAKDTLSGAGLRTPLADIASAVSVVTPEFFADTASTNLRDVLVYQSNIEVGGMGGNAALTDESGREPSLGNEASTRVRGLATATSARNFFRSTIPTDSYNAGRLDINRGANALLFGVASPAGIINYSTQDASFGKTAGQISFLADNYGRNRVTLNHNQIIVPKQLAIRLAAVDDDRTFKQEPAYNHSKRAYAALTWQIKALERGILAGTTIKANYEKGAIDSNNPRTLPPQNWLSNWFEDTISPDVKGLGINAKSTYDPYQVYNANNLTNYGWRVMQQANRSPVLVFNDPNSTMPSAPTNIASSQPVFARPFVTSNYFFSGINTVSTGAQFSTNSYSDILNRKSYPDAGFYYAQSITDPGVFDFYNNILEGPNKEERMRFHAQNIVLEQLLFGGQAGFELAFDKQVESETRRSLTPEDLSFIAVDVNTRMFDGSPNPNFGRAFTSASGQATYDYTVRETFRAKAFYKLDLRDKGKPWLGKLLGHHTFSVLRQDEHTDDERRAGRMYSVAENWPNGNNQDRFSDLGKLVNTVSYLSSSLIGVTNPANGDIGRITADRMDLPGLLNGKGVFLTRLQASNATQAKDGNHNLYTAPFTIIGGDRELTEMASGATKTRLDLRSTAVAVQSYFLDDHIVAMYGERREEAENKLVTAPTVTDGQGYRLVNSPDYDLDRPGLPVIENKGKLTAWSVVGKLPEPWMNRTPLNAFSVYYGESTNFDPPQSRSQSVFGDDLPAASGSSKDYGFSFDALHNKVSFRVNFFESKQINTRNSALSQATISIMERHKEAFNSITNGFNPDSNGDHFPDGYVAPPQAVLDLFKTKINGNTLTYTSAGVVDTSDYVAKGVEIESVIRPTRNLTVSLNVSQQKSTRSNSGKYLRELLFNTPLANGQTLNDAWTSNAAGNIALTMGAVGVPFTTGTLAHYFNLFILNPYNKVALADGGPATELREWRANASASYSFRQGMFKGVKLGGAARWQDKVAIGYPIVSYRADGTLVGTGAPQSTDFRSYDIAHPYYGPDDLNIDTWVSYQRPIWKKRFDFKVQLNVRNLFADEDLIPIRAQPDGSIAIYRIPSPRTISLTTTFGF